MAKYTTELFNVMQELGGTRYNPYDIRAIPTIILSSWDKIFMDFPLWDENYREILCTKILAHYYRREIGLETPSYFVFALNRKMNEIMPYYNLLYKTIIDDMQQFQMDMYEDYIGNEKGQTNDSANGDRKSGTQDRRNREENINENTSGNQETTNDVNSSTSGNETASDKNSGSVDRERNLKDVTDRNENSQDDTNSRDSTEYNSELEKRKNSSQTVDYNSGTNRSGSDTTKTDNQDITKNSDTPQGALTGVLADRYLTTASVDDLDGKQVVTYGSREQKTGNDTTSTQGSDSDIHTGTDTATGEKHSQGKSNSMETSDHTGTETETSYENNTHSSSTSGNTQTHETGKQKHDDTRNENLKSTEDYISNFLENTHSNASGHSNKDTIYTRHTHGRNSSNWIDEIMKWRDSLINIDMMIVNELETLFMQLW